MAAEAPGVGGGVEVGEGAARPASRGREAQLLERERELELLAAVLAEARSGRGGVAVVAGPAGIGKTRLLDAARELALRSELSVLRARASELELEFPFGVVRQLFEPALARSDERDALLAGAAALARPILDPQATAPAARGDSFALLHGLYWLTANLSERAPLLVLVDDVQWCDGVSVEFLGYLARRLDALPVALVVAARAGEPVAAAAAFDALAAEASLRLDPPPLSEEAARRLLDSTFGAASETAFALACHRATNGNPLLLHELARVLLSKGTAPVATSAGEVTAVGAEAVSGFVLRRLARLSPASRELARAVAVLGDGASVDEVARLAGLSPPEAADVAGGLVRADLLRPGPRLEFTHPLVRDAVYAAMSASERERSHAAVASALIAAGAEPERTAVHLLYVRPATLPAVTEVLRDAARRSLADGAPAAAAAFLERALAEPSAPQVRARLVHELGEAALRVDPRSAVGHLREAVELLDDGERRAEAALLLGQALYLAGEGSEAIDVLERALAEAPARQELQDRFEYELANALAGSIRTHEALERVERIHRQYLAGVRSGSPLVFVLLGWLSGVSRLAHADTVAFAKAALADDVLLREEAYYDAFASVAQTLLAAEEYETAEAVFRRAQALAVERGSAHNFAWSTFLRARLHYYRGRLDDAEAEARAGLAAVESHDLGVIRAVVAPALADVLLERGELTEATELIGSARAADRTHDDFELLLSSAQLRLALERPEEALADAEEVRRRFEGTDVGKNPHGPWRSTLAQALAALGRTDEALAAARAELELARQWGTPRPLGHALRVLGTFEGGAQGIAQLEEAVTVLAGSAARLEHAHALAALGAAVRRAGRRAEAREPLYQALELAHLCGATALEARVRDELVVAGARPRRVMLRGVDALTASERRVAQLAASGKTNKEIAQALFVTLKTVEMHLASVYRKLAIRSRTQLPAALGDAAEPGL